MPEGTASQSGGGGDQWENKAGCDRHKIWVVRFLKLLMVKDRAGIDSFTTIAGGNGHTVVVNDQRPDIFMEMVSIEQDVKYL